MIIKRQIRPCLTLLILIALAPTLRAQDIIVVANPGIYITQITPAELREIFIGQRSTFRDHSRAVPVLLKGGPAHEVFLRNHLGETAESFRALWRKAVFTGQGAAPREFGSEAALLQFIAETPGAIGYVSRVSGKENVRIVAVQKPAR
jgi:ABC-type phosphate transport system substrate-binding protein